MRKPIRECGNCRYRQNTCCTNEDVLNGPYKDYLALLSSLIGQIEAVTVGPHFSCPNHESPPD